MGMSASQVRLLTMTKRIHDIENEAQRIQNQKMMLGNQSDEAYEEYLNALEQKNIQATSFNPETGTFVWNEVGVEGLYDNGYALKIQGTKTNTVLTTAASSNVSLPGSTLGAVVNVSIKEQNESNFAQNTQNNKNVSNSYYNALTDPNNTVGGVSDLITGWNLPGDFHGNYNVIKINSAQDLITLAKYANMAATHANKLSGKTFILTNDIVFTPTDAATYASYINMTPGAGFGFTLRNSTFLGNGHTISGLTSSLFTKIDTDTTQPDAQVVIQDVEFKNCSLTGSDSAILAKDAYGNIDIDNCYVTGCNIGSSNSTSQTSNAGGLIATVQSVSGTANDITISNSAIDSDVNIFGTQTCGGYIGLISNDGTINITNCGSSAVLKGITVTASNVGGFVGRNPAADLNITNSYESFISNEYNGVNKKAIVGSGSADLTNCALPAVDDDMAYNGNTTQCANVYSIDITITAGGTSHTYTFDDPDMSMSDICHDLQASLREDLHDPSISVTVTSDGLKIKSDFADISGVNMSNTVGNYVNVGQTVGCPGTALQSEETCWTYCRSWQDVFTALGTSTSFDCPSLLRELIANAMAIICTYTEDAAHPDEDGYPTRTYTETSVSVDTHLREVQNDQDLAKAEANYEAALRKIDQKDKKYDKELAAIDSERNAVKAEFDTLKNCIKENIDRTFKVFNG